MNASGRAECFTDAAHNYTFYTDKSNGQSKGEKHAAKRLVYSQLVAEGGWKGLKLPQPKAKFGFSSRMSKDVGFATGSNDSLGFLL